MSEVEQKNEKTISLVELWLLFKKSWITIVSIVLLCSVLGCLAAGLLAKPKYTATVEFAVDNYITDDTGNDQEYGNDRNALYAAIELIPSVAQLIEKDRLKKDVIKNAGDNSNVQYNYASGIKVNYSDDSIFFSISYTTTVGEEAAYETVNQVAKSIINVTNATDGEGNPEVDILSDKFVVFDYATLETVKVKQMWPRYVLISVFVGIIFAVAYLIIKYLSDDTIRSKTLLEKITGFKTIAFIEDIDSSK